MLHFSSSPMTNDPAMTRVIIQNSQQWIRSNEKILNITARVHSNEVCPGPRDWALFLSADERLALVYLDTENERWSLLRNLRMANCSPTFAGLRTPLTYLISNLFTLKILPPACKKFAILCIQFNSIWLFLLEFWLHKNHVCWNNLLSKFKFWLNMGHNITACQSVG